MVMAKLHCHLVVAGIVQNILGSVLIEAQNTNFSFTYFNTSDSFLMIDDVIHDAGNSSFTMNSMNPDTPSTSNSPSPSRCGRLLYKDRVRVKDLASGAVASFQTAFSFQITGPTYTISGSGGIIHGDGLAFSFVRSNASTTVTGEDAGGSLCLLKSENNGLPSNRLFAIEFDTFQNLGLNDSSDSHIGVDINSMNSTWSHNLCPNGASVTNCTYLCNGGFFTTWIDYDSPLQKLEVFFVSGSLSRNIPKPAKPLIEVNLSLSDLMDEYMYVGFTSSTGGVTELHQIQSWSFDSSGLPDVVPDPIRKPSSNGSIRKVRAVLAGSISTGAVVALLVALGLYIARSRRSLSRSRQDKLVTLVDQNLVPRMFTYKELLKATKNFNKSEFLGSGGFGAVYSGRLPSGARVAVKRMRMEGKHEKESFQAEVASLSHIRHRNLVQLRGWCHEEDQLLLVYEYMCNGSLDKWLFWASDSDLNEDELLPLNLRHSVLSGVAAALSYLHEECEKCVLHRDIKSSNVLLDGHWNAYLGDFGLARLIDHQKMEKTTAMAGTFGYMAPEIPTTWKATKESDVYSFGVLMLEVMCGRRALEMSAIERGEGVLVDRVWRAHEAGNILEVADSRLLEAFPPSDHESSPSKSEELETPRSSKELWMQEATSAFITNDVHDVDPSAIPASDSAIQDVDPPAAKAPYVTMYDEDSSAIAAPDGAMEGRKLIRNLLHLGLVCCNPNPENRPSMRLVSQVLQSSENMELSLPPLPACKPKAHFVEIGFSEDIMPSSSQWSYAYGFNAEATAALGSSQVLTISTLPSSSVSQEERLNLRTAIAE